MHCWHCGGEVFLNNSALQHFDEELDADHEPLWDGYEEGPDPDEARDRARERQWEEDGR